MSLFSGITLTRRLIGLVSVGFLALAGAIMLQSEKALEAAILEQVRGQSEIFLRGVARDLNVDPSLDMKGVERILDRVISEAGSSPAAWRLRPTRRWMTSAAASTGWPTA